MEDLTMINRKFLAPGRRLPTWVTKMRQGSIYNKNNVPVTWVHSSAGLSALDLRLVHSIAANCLENPRCNNEYDELGQRVLHGLTRHALDRT